MTNIQANFDYRQGNIFIFTTLSIKVLRPTDPPTNGHRTYLLRSDAAGAPSMPMLRMGGAIPAHPYTSAQHVYLRIRNSFPLPSFTVNRHL